MKRAAFHVPGHSGCVPWIFSDNVVAQPASRPRQRRRHLRRRPQQRPSPLPQLRTRRSRPRTASSTTTHADQNALIQRYCAGCHNERGKDKVAQLVLTGFDVSKAAQHAPIAEKMIRKLRARHDAAARAAASRPAQLPALVETLETTVDRPRRSIPIPAPARSSGSIAPSTSAPSATCSASTSTRATICRSTPRARTSTTSPTCRRCRRRCSRRT